MVFTVHRESEGDVECDEGLMSLKIMQKPYTTLVLPCTFHDTDAEYTVKIQYNYAFDGGGPLRQRFSHVYRLFR